MEWVETTAKTLEAAKDLALDKLGVHEDDAEFEVLETPRAGLFGMTRGAARVRARVKPIQPRPKMDRRDRRRQAKSQRGDGSQGKPAPAARTESGDAPEKVVVAERAEKRAPRRKRGGGQAPRDSETSKRQEPAVSQGATLQEQAEIVAGFMEGLLDAFGLEAEVSKKEIDDETAEVQVDGGDLGLLVGPRGATLSAISDLARSAVQRQRPGAHEGRVRLDIAQYRERRREALERFTRRIADEVASSGTAKTLEPMTAADRKIVHDVVGEIEGVSSTSEGEEPRRRVVILPDQG